MGTLLAIRGLEVELGGRPVLRAVGLEVPEGASVALVGESGSGKSTLLRACMGLLPPGSVLAGELRWSPAGVPPVDLLAATPAQWRRLRGAELVLIPQEPSAALDPRRRAGAHLGECLAAAGLLPRKARAAAALAALAAVGIGGERARDYPHQWSGGMQQRLLTAMALARRPRLVLADEPTSALDTLHQARLLALLARLQAARGFARLWVTHDLAVAAALASHVFVLSAGEIVEQGSAAALFTRPCHPRTRALVAAQPNLDAALAAAGARGGA